MSIPPMEIPPGDNPMTDAEVNAAWFADLRRRGIVDELGIDMTRPELAGFNYDSAHATFVRLTRAAHPHPPKLSYLEQRELASQKAAERRAARGPTYLEQRELASQKAAERRAARGPTYLEQRAIAAREATQRRITRLLSKAAAHESQAAIWRSEAEELKLTLLVGE